MGKSSQDGQSSSGESKNVKKYGSANSATKHGSGRFGSGSKRKKSFNTEDAALLGERQETGGWTWKHIAIFSFVSEEAWHAACEYVNERGVEGAAKGYSDFTKEFGKTSDVALTVAIVVGIFLSLNQTRDNRRDRKTVTPKQIYDIVAVLAGVWGAHVFVPWIRDASIHLGDQTQGGLTVKCLSALVLSILPASIFHASASTFWGAFRQFEWLRAPMALDLRTAVSLLNGVGTTVMTELILHRYEHEDIGAAERVATRLAVGGALNLFSTAVSRGVYYLGKKCFPGTREAADDLERNNASINDLVGGGDDKGSLNGTNVGFK